MHSGNWEITRMLSRRTHGIRICQSVYMEFVDPSYEFPASREWIASFNFHNTAHIILKNNEHFVVYLHILNLLSLIPQYKAHKIWGYF